LYAFFIFPIHATCPAHFINLNLITLIVFDEAPHYTVLSILLPLPHHQVLSILLSTLFSSTLNLCSSHSVRDQLPHPYRTRGKVIVFYTLIFSFHRGDGRTKDSELNGSKYSPNLICS
jgi:hypothetical protein